MHSLLSFCGRDFISLASLSVRGGKRGRVVGIDGLQLYRIVQFKIALFSIFKTFKMFTLNGVLVTSQFAFFPLVRVTNFVS